MSKYSLEENIDKIIKLAQDLINCEDEDVSYFGGIITSYANQASLAVDDYTPTQSYDHSDYKELYHA